MNLACITSLTPTTQRSPWHGPALSVQAGYTARDLVTTSLCPDESSQRYSP